IASGTVTSQQLRRMSTDSSTTTYRSANQSRDGPSSTLTSTFSSLDPDSEATTIYHAFISALKSSLLKLLVKGEEWLELGADSCIRLSEGICYPATAYDLLLDDYGRNAQWLRLHVRWSLSGILTVSSHVGSHPGLCTLSDVVKNETVSGRCSIDVGHPVIISPFGSQYEFAGSDKHDSGSWTVNRCTKSSALALLTRLGIRITSDMTWARLRAPIGHLRGPRSVESRSLIERWWPAHLCFVMIPIGHTSSTEVLEHIADGTFVDPLVKAQQWFLDRDAREVAIEAQRKEDEDRKLEEVRLSEPRMDSQVDEDSATYQAARIDQYLSAQEASSIYPTPPDGLTSHIPSSSMHQMVPTTEGHVASADDHEAAASHMLETNSSGTNLSGANFEAGEEPNLFEDMETDMFEANGLTEDDFNFFDEPDGNDNDANLGHQTSATLYPEWSGPEERYSVNAAVPSISTIPDDVQMDAEDGLEELAQNANVVSDDAIRFDLSGMASKELDTDISESEDITAMPTPKDENNPKIMLDSKEELVEADGAMKRSSFDLVTLRSGLQHLNEKYRNDGKYATSFPKPFNSSGPGRTQPTPDRKLPKIGPLLARSKHSTEDMDDDSRSSGSFDDWDNGNESISSSDKGHLNASNEGHSSLPKKRKREPSAISQGLVSPAESADLSEFPNDSFDSIIFDLKQDIAGYHRAGDLFQSLENHPTARGFIFHGDNQDFIQIAQLVADQKVLQNGLIRNTCNDMICVEQPSFPDNPKSSSDLVQAILSESFPDPQQCDLRAVLELESSSVAKASSMVANLQEDAERQRQATAQSHGREPRTDQIQKLQAPYMSVRRGEAAMDMATTALYFWEELSLAPANDGKNVIAFCIYPENDTIRDAASLFMTTMDVSYQSCKFGRHQRGSGSRRYQEGLVPIPTSSASPDIVFQRVEEVCVGLGTDIPHKEADGTNYVIYMVNPFNNDAALPHLSSAFLRLFSTYVSFTKTSERSLPRDLVLQVIPISFLADCHCLTIPPPKAYTELAFEVYSRCGPAPQESRTMQSPFASTSAIRLARPIPKTINFRLTPQPPDVELSADSCIHLAYSWNSESQWLACAWSDNLGVVQWSTVYCLQDPDPDFWAAFSETVKEVLDTTKDMLQPNSRPWKLYVVKDSAVQRQELEVWRLHSASAFQQHVTVTLLSIDASPPLSLPPYQAAATFPLQSSSLDTSPAASTPFDPAPTPDHSSPINTHTPNRHTLNSPSAPSASGSTDPDPAARLVDVVSETWCMISPSPIPDPYLPTPDLAPILRSGYLLKRAGTDDEDGLIPLGVNLVCTDLSRHEPGTLQVQTRVLRDVLGMYGDLACLARLRGTEEWRNGVLPWHVAAARKARKAVSGCMKWGSRRR
ncbi:MAG: hypothetical protein Q9196_006471, partial [Gyalolechia fulgens]